jgi:16S rRNA (cytidine1402-2'-O)-methyltransferase
MPGTLFVVATPIGNLEDITARALRVLREVTVIAAEDTRRTARLLARYAIRTPMTSLHAHNEYGKAPSLVERLLSGQSVAVVSDAGTPALADPGATLVKAAVAAGVQVEAIPGPSALTSLLSVAGLAVPSFVFMGFPPTKRGERDRWFKDVARSGRTTVFFEAPHRIKSTLNQLLTVSGDCQIVVGRELTKQHEQIIRGSLSDVVKSDFPARGELTIIAEIGLTTEQMRLDPAPQHPLDEPYVGETPELVVDRRTAAEMASVLGLKTNDVYAAFVRARQSVK